MPSNKPQPTERLESCCKPRCKLVLFETQPPLLPTEPTIERYTTANRKVFERHVQPMGVATWYQVVR